MPGRAFKPCALAALATTIVAVAGCGSSSPTPKSGNAAAAAVSSATTSLLTTHSATVHKAAATAATHHSTTRTQSAAQPAAQQSGGSTPQSAPAVVHTTSTTTTQARAVAAGGLSGTYKATIPPPSSLKGNYQITFKPGHFVVHAPYGIVGNGTDAISGSTITVHGPGTCEGAGTYHFTVTSTTLTFKKIKDSCPRVAVLTARPWKKV